MDLSGAIPINRNYNEIDQSKEDFLPGSVSDFNRVYNNGLDYHDPVKPCSDGYENQCAIRITYLSSSSFNEPACRPDTLKVSNAELGSLKERDQHNDESWLAVES